jgi:class 3 adenylate cyclase
MEYFQMVTSEPVTVQAQYVFLDIVGYSYKRSVEAQVEIIGKLNSITEDAVKNLGIQTDNLVYLPTGDGMCIALLGINEPYDIHIQLALVILHNLQTWNDCTTDEMRKFKIRIGINSNRDNLVVDINGKRNIAGAGINMAQRIMSMADGNQIMVGDSDFEILRHREKYMNGFTDFTATVKHGFQILVHQLSQKGYRGLDVATPIKFAPKKKAELKLTQIAAHYFGHCIKNEAFILEQQGKSQTQYSCIVLMYLHAMTSDDLEFAKKTFDTGSIWYPGRGNLTLQEQLDYLDTLEFRIVCELATFIYEKHLEPYRSFIKRELAMSIGDALIRDQGKAKLKAEWPDIHKLILGETV